MVRSSVQMSLICKPLATERGKILHWTNTNEQANKQDPNFVKYTR